MAIHEALGIPAVFNPSVRPEIVEAVMSVD